MRSCEREATASKLFKLVQPAGAFCRQLTVVSIDVDVARFRVEARADQGQHGQFLHFFLVGHCCFSHCRDVQMVSGGEGGGSGYSSACSHEIIRHFLLGRKVMTNLDSIFFFLDSILKSRDITLPTKVHLIKAMVFPIVNVWM